MGPSNVNLKRDIEDIRALHMKIIRMIQTCENLDHLIVTNRYYTLAIRMWSITYPTNHIYANHNELLSKVKNHIDTLSRLKRKQLRGTSM